MTFEAPECQTFSRYDNYGPYYVQNSLRFLNKGWETRLTRWIHSATSLFSRGHVSGKTVAFRVVMALSTKKQFSGSNKVNSNKDGKSDLQSSLMNLPRTKISLWYDVGVLIKKRDCTIREFFYVRYWFKMDQSCKKNISVALAVSSDEIRLRTGQKENEFIDALVGGLAEEPEEGAILSPTLACLLKKVGSNLRSAIRWLLMATWLWTYLTTYHQIF